MASSRGASFGGDQCFKGGIPVPGCPFCSPTNQMLFEGDYWWAWAAPVKEGEKLEIVIALREHNEYLRSIAGPAWVELFDALVRLGSVHGFTQGELQMSMLLSDTYERRSKGGFHIHVLFRRTAGRFGQRGRKVGAVTSDSTKLHSPDTDELRDQLDRRRREELESRGDNF